MVARRKRKAEEMVTPNAEASGAGDLRMINEALQMQILKLQTEVTGLKDEVKFWKGLQTGHEQPPVMLRCALIVSLIGAV